MEQVALMVIIISMFFVNSGMVNGKEICSKDARIFAIPKHGMCGWDHSKCELYCYNIEEFPTLKEDAGMITKIMFQDSYLSNQVFVPQTLSKLIKKARCLLNEWKGWKSGERIEMSTCGYDALLDNTLRNTQPFYLIKNLDEFKTPSNMVIFANTADK